MSEVAVQPDRKPIRVLSITRKVIQFLSFMLINYTLIEFIFNADFSLLQDWLRVLPFLQAPESTWAAGAGLMEYIFHTIIDGKVPWFFLGLLGIFGIFSGRIFCGWFCPAGFVQDLFAGLAGKQSKRMKIDTDKAQKKFKFVLLVIWFGLFIPLGIFKNTNAEQFSTYSEALGSLVSKPLWPISLSEFLFVSFPEAVQSIYESASPGNLFTELSYIQIVLFFVYIIVLVISVFWPRFYCRVGCPFGAGISLFSRFSLLKLRRIPTRCPGRKECGVCEQVCPMQIRILDEPFGGFTGKGECTLCLECMEQCPHDAIKWKFGF